MFIAYLVTTLVAALANAYAASLNFVGAESVKVAAGRVGVSQRWMIPFGVLLAMGAGGLLVGLAVPVVGAAASACLVLYFICALGAHIRVHDHAVGAAISFLVLEVAALAATLAYHDHDWA
jgi:DoxX-like family